MNNTMIKPENNPRSGRPKAVKGNAILCLDSSLPGPAIKDALRADGWQVYCSRTAGEMRALTCEMDDAVVMLSDRLPGNESAWLTTRKLLMTEKNIKVVVLGNRPSARSERMADFVGAKAYIAVTDAHQFRDRLNDLMIAD